ncbi:MAG: class I SAM-dependent methyltransferase [Acidobacteriota bacterium]
MRRVESHAQVLSDFAAFNGRVTVDVGCGTGDLVRWMASQGARAVGLDAWGMITKALTASASGAERFFAGAAQALPLRDRCADLVYYVASFHHVPRDDMPTALLECERILSPCGAAYFVEPVACPGAYSEVVRLHEDESKVQAAAYEALRSAGAYGLKEEFESFYYIERSFLDFARLMEVFEEDPIRRDRILQEARRVTEGLARNGGTTFEKFRFRSVCRLNVLRKHTAQRG